MLENTAINRAAIHKIAKALGPLNEQVVYVGGAVVSLYVNDPAAEDARPTKDVDISVAIASLGELESLREALTRKGFIQSPEDNVVCRFRYEGTKVDVMSTQAIGWAPANQWFAPGFAQRETIDNKSLPIYILPLPYFLASKFSAFEDRGAKDPRTSHDLEDIVYVLDNRIDITEQLIQAPKDVKSYLQTAFTAILEDTVKQEAILGYLPYNGQGERFARIMECLKEIIAEQ